MESLGEFLIRNTCWLAGFWLVYYLFLRKETFYHLNRWFLLIGITLSVIMSLHTINYTVVKEVASPLLTVEEANQHVTEVKQHGIGLSYWLLVVYLIGFSVFLVMSVVRFIKLRELKRGGRIVYQNNQKVVQVRQEMAPFSFFNTIFVGKCFVNQDEMKSIVIHEKVHIEERHWVDLVLLEIIRAIQWYNPVVLMYRKAVTQNHEYLADSGVLHKGVNPLVYKALLANQMLGYQVVGVTSSFKSFNPSKRITMMNKHKTLPIQKLRLFAVLPVIAIIMFAFAEPEYKYIDNGQENSASVAVSNGEIKGTVTDKNGNAMYGVSIIISGTTAGTISDKNGHFILDGVNDNNEITFSFVGYKTVKQKARKTMQVSLEKKEHVISTSEKRQVPPAAVQLRKTERVLHGKDARVFVLVEEMPSFPGGKTALVKYQEGIFGKQVSKSGKKIKFVVNKDGSLSDVSYSLKDFKEADVKRYIENMPAWIPGKQRGVPVDVMITIKF